MSTVIGIDIGGSKIAAGSLQHDKLVDRKEIPTGAERSAEEILDSLYKMLEPVMNQEVAAIGIGVPGIIDVDRGRIVRINNIPSFNGLELKEMVESHFSVPVKVNNDANCFILGEATFGSGKAFRNIIGITLGTGVGGGIVIDKKLYSSKLASTGEFGCLPYLDGVFEDYGGSQFFTRNYGLTGEDLFKGAIKGDGMALEAFENYGQHLAALIQQLLCIFAPDAIIIGGSISRAIKYFKKPVVKMLEDFPIPEVSASLEILPASLPDPGIYGAASLVL